MKPTRLGSKAQWVALGLSGHIGAKTLHNLLEHFDHLDAVFAADETELLDVPGIGDLRADAISRIDLAKTARDILQWEGQGLRVLTPLDDLYPPPLGDISDYPLTLFARGQWHPSLWWKTMAIVGARRPSPKAERIAKTLAAKLARAGYTIISGLALGIDAAAHEGAIQAGGAGIAVLGSGLLHVYPPQNKDIAKRLRRRGALISEVQPNLPPNAQRLVWRNRIISAMSAAVIVVESDEDGGAMHTARFAREQGRPIYTFDLPAAGNQKLIQQGAKVIADDLTMPAIRPQSAFRRAAGQGADALHRRYWGRA